MGWEEAEYSIFTYANYTAFWSVGREDVKTGLNRWNEYCEKASFRMNMDKIVILRVRRKRDGGSER